MDRGSCYNLVMHDINFVNPYLHGLYAPVREEISAEKLEVIGEIPRDLHGAYFRNGPNPKTSPKGMHHWFDGDGMVHGVWFENGEARYRNRYVQTQDLKANGSSVLGGIFDPARDAPGRKVHYRDTANTDLVYHNGKLLALWYISGQPVAVDASTLETICTETFDGALPNNISAHSKVDPETGELVFFDYSLYEPKMWTGTVSAQGELTQFQEIDLPGPRLPHDMGMTENYVILHDLPVIFSDSAIRNRLWQIHVADQQTRFGVVPRKGGAPKWFEFPTCYVYHVINAWEEGDDVVMAACKMVPNGFEPDAKYGPYAAMADVLALRAQPFVWRMNMKTGKAREEQLDDALSEFPVVNNNFAGRKTQYSYHVIFDDCIEQRFTGLLKYNLLTGASERHHFPKGVFGSEPAFAPKVSADGEDDGYLITFTQDFDGRSEAQVIDAQNISAPPLARIKLPQRVPLGFHGVWAPDV
ncbi:carotenoid oxygenase family protein [Hyphococcus flavus]|uniref:Dioxygenase n=1 Tax=Hyphococcus flavus TaxID=1866326 RepID=A0AAE9ZAZ3_9PROT|nr:carotenoid oxygenase family protein [Hyphococcus flavus]WDI30571.1 carotenoid oxygenase family protein [Hyphococcus flavus]